MDTSRTEGTEMEKESKEQLGHLYLREKEKRVELAQQLSEAKREIKRLNQTIEKMSHHEKNAVLYFETTIKELQEANSQYRAKLESYDGMHLKCKKPSNMSQSKLNRSVANQSMRQSYISSALENKENNNFLNTEYSNCTSPLCEAKQELQEIKGMTSSIVASLHNLAHSIQGKRQWASEQHEKWMKMLEGERSRRKSDASKSSLQLVRIMQEKINSIALTLQKEGEKGELASQPLFDSLRTLTQKQKCLTKTPFLEKIDLKQRKEDADLFVESAQLMKQRMLAHLRK